MDQSYFSDDPMRAVRLAGQSVRFGFAIDNDTLPLAIAAKEELAHEPMGRVAAELGKVLSEAQQPGRFFKVLVETNLLQVTFKEISDLSQGEFERVIAALDSVAKVTQNSKLRFAAFGLALDQDSLVLWNNRMKLPGDWLDAAITVSQTIGFLAIPTPDKIVDTIYKLRRGSLTIEEFDLIAEAAGLRIPKLGSLKDVMGLPKGEVVPKTLKGKEIGEWLREKNVKAISEQLLSGNSYLSKIMD